MASAAGVSGRFRSHVEVRAGAWHSVSVEPSVRLLERQSDLKQVAAGSLV